jgi:hypothetical protein
MYMPPRATDKFIYIIPVMDVMRSVYCAIMDVLLFSSVTQSSVEPLSQQADFYTVEVAKAIDKSRLAKPMIAAALHSLLDCKQVYAADHDIKLCILAIADNFPPVKSPEFFDSRYKTIIMDNSLEGDYGVKCYATFPKKQAMLWSVRFGSVRVRVVPVTLLSVIFSAYHASAGNVNASFKASFWKLRL